MAISTRIIRRRIKSIGNTKKITKAMEMVSASKMRKAVNAVLATRPYSNLGWETVTELAHKTDQSLHPLLRASANASGILIIAIASDRGLCAGFNAQLTRKVVEFVKLQHTTPSPSSERRGSETISPPARGGVRGGGSTIEFLTIGKKGTDFARRMGWNIVATFSNLSNNPSILDVRPVVKLAIDDFVAGKYGRVYLAYTDFMSSIRQVPNIRQLLPIVKDDKMLGEVNAPSPVLRTPSPSGRGEGEGQYGYEYLFEPSPQEILDQMLPRLVEVQVYQAILESSASEHSARMIAMKNASDAARDMIADLTFTFNQARQATITREIAEISAGKAAIE